MLWLTLLSFRLKTNSIEMSLYCKSAHSGWTYITWDVWFLAIFHSNERSLEHYLFRVLWLRVKKNTKYKFKPTRSGRSEQLPSWLSQWTSSEMRVTCSQEAMWLLSRRNQKFLGSKQLWKAFVHRKLKNQMVFSLQTARLRKKESECELTAYLLYQKRSPALTLSLMASQM